MWSNYGLAVQIKHLSLNVEMARSISQSVTANKIVIVCKKAEESVISSVLNQLGWMSRIQSIITEEDLLIWYTKALRGKYSSTIGPKILHLLREELSTEFPVVDATEFDAFYTQRNYPSALKQLEVFESEL